MGVNKNTHAASEGAYVSSELLTAVYSRAHRDNHGLINDCSDRWFKGTSEKEESKSKFHT